MQDISVACGPGTRTSLNALYHTKSLKQHINAGLTFITSSVTRYYDDSDRQCS